MSVGTTRIKGTAGASMDITAFLAGDLSERRVPAIINLKQLIYGDGVSSVEIVYADKITLSDGGNETLDLFDGGLLDIFGRPLTMAAIKLLYVENTSTDSGLTIGGKVDNDLLIFADTSDKVYIPAGGTFLWLCPTAAGVVTTARKNLYLLDDGTGAAGDKFIEVIAMGLD